MCRLYLNNPKEYINLFLLFCAVRTNLSFSYHFLSAVWSGAKLADVLELVGIPNLTSVTRSGGKHVEFVSIDKCKVHVGLWMSFWKFFACGWEMDFIWEIVQFCRRRMGVHIKHQFHLVKLQTQKLMFYLRMRWMERLVCLPSSNFVLV